MPRDRVDFNKLTVRVFPARDLKRTWIARIRLDDGEPLDGGQNVWAAQGRSPTDAVAMAAEVCRLLTDECLGGDRKHRWRPNNRAAVRGELPASGRYCPRCKTWKPE